MVRVVMVVPLLELRAVMEGVAHSCNANWNLVRSVGTGSTTGVQPEMRVTSPLHTPYVEGELPLTAHTA